MLFTLKNCHEIVDVNINACVVHNASIVPVLGAIVTVEEFAWVRIILGPWYVVVSHHDDIVLGNALSLEKMVRVAQVGMVTIVRVPF